MACTVTRDEHGALYRVPEFKPKDPKSKLEPLAHIDVWWDRDAVHKDDELLVIRQEMQEDRADVVMLTLGQAFDLLHAVASAIKDI